MSPSAVTREHSAATHGRARGAALLVSALLAALLTLTPGSALAAPPRPTAELTAEDVDTWLGSVVPILLDREAIPGATVSVVANGGVLLERGYGYAETGHDGGDPVPVVPEETLFRVGSISKVPVATAVMQLVEDGRIDLDAPVAEHLDFELDTRFDTPITMRHLLTHTAGFEDVYRNLLVSEPSETPALRDYLIAQMPEQIFDPGTMPAYSNYGYALAAYVVQEVSGIDAAEYLQTQVLDPAGMASATYAQPLPADLAERAALVYPATGQAPIDFELFGPWPAGSLSATASDMSALMLAHLDLESSPLLAPETLEQMHSAALTEESLGSLAHGAQMTLGFFEQDRNGHRILGHSGDLIDSHAAFQILPGDGVGIFIGLNGSGVDATSSSDVRDEVMDGFTDRYFPATEEQSEPTETSAEHAQVPPGFYQVTRRAETNFAAALSMLSPVRVTADGGRLHTPALADAAGEPVPLVEVEPWVFQTVGGQERLTVRVGDAGQVEALSISPASSLQPAPVWQAPLAGALAASGVILLVSLLAWPVRGLIGLRLRAPLDLPPREAMLRRLGLGASVVVFTAVGLWALVAYSIMNAATVPLGGLARGAQVATLLGLLGVVPTAWRAVLTWRRRAWFLAALATLIALAFAAFGAFAVASSLLVPDLSY